MQLALKDGIQLYNEKKYNQALVFFLSFSSDDFNVKTEVNYYTGLIYSRLDQYENALEYLEQVVTANIDIAKVYQCRLILAFIYAKTERHRLAEFELSQLVAGGYESAQVFSSIAYVAYEHNEVQRSIDYYEKALSSDAENSTALNGLGYVLAKTERDLPKAMQLCRKAVEKYPENPAYLDSIAFVYYKTQLHKEASMFIKKAKEKLPDNKIVLSHYKMIMSEYLEDQNV